MTMNNLKISGHTAAEYFHIECAGCGGRSLPVRAPVLLPLAQFSKLDFYSSKLEVVHRKLPLVDDPGIRI